MRESERITPQEIRRFRQIIFRYYRRHGRTLPWRATDNPYHILISEIMLQQTQVERVMGKYERFIAAFPDFASLSKAPLREIFPVWQGLGYNRRAVALKRIAHAVMEEFGGKLPSSVDALALLPGIGKATASAIAAFAFHQ
ncbi:MAG TPA: hypothetical protein VF790_08370, partial [Dissulfurispiraceae bacterium]